MECRRLLRCHATVISCISVRPGRTNGLWVTQVGSGQFHNLTRGNAPGLANCRSAPRVLAEGSRRVLGSQTRGRERRPTSAFGRCQCWEDNPAILEAWPNRLVARRFATRVPHTRTGRSTVRFRRHRRIEGQPSYCACRAPLSLPLWAPDAGIHLLRQGSLPAN